ncbi:MAG TPA: glycosyltransferase family 4 protein [Moheibacter sp.]|nr:glycosyltransferase family 4 protein [Moheibacter sp.]
MIQNKVLFIGLVWPEPNSSAAGKRILQLVDFFVKRGDEVIFCSSASKSESSFDFSNWTAVKEVAIALNNVSFDIFVKELKPDIVVFDRFVSEEQFGWRIRENCPNAIQILDTEDLHFLRNAREIAFKKQTELHFENPMKLREITSILRCDLSIMISEVEMKLLMNEFKISKELLFYLPFLEEIENNKNLKSFEERRDFVFIGNFLHEPNWQCVLELKKTIWPKIKKKLPTANLHIYGAYASQKVTDLHQPKAGFWVHGKAESAHEVIEKARVLLAPLPFGAGQKGKFIDAMQMGTPIATNSLGAEAMFTHSIPGVVEDSTDFFVQKTVELYENQELWENAQQVGQEILKVHFDKNQWIPLLDQHLNFLQKNLKQHRQQNYLGQILHQNSMNALKYMSLWIEEKNKSAQ